MREQAKQIIRARIDFNWACDMQALYPKSRKY